MAQPVESFATKPDNLSLTLEHNPLSCPLNISCVYLKIKVKIKKKKRVGYGMVAHSYKSQHLGGTENGKLEAISLVYICDPVSK